tara:strand:+ start:334 stop:624 length:291 start_codon:yes stop_codon:yes gene_type:complete
MKCPSCGSNMKVRAKSVFDDSLVIISSNKNDIVRLTLYCPKRYDKSDPCQVDHNYGVEVSGFREWIKAHINKDGGQYVDQFVSVRIEDYGNKEVGA